MVAKNGRAALDTTIRGRADSLMTPLGAAQLVVALKAPKSGFRALSEFFTQQPLKYSLKTGRPFPRLMYMREALGTGWRARFTNSHPQSPLEPCLPEDTHGPSLLGSVTCNRATLSANALTGHAPSCSLCGAMCSPCTGGGWSHLGAALANYGAFARQPAFYWVITMAVCVDNDMAHLGAMRRDNLHVEL